MIIPADLGVKRTPRARPRAKKGKAPPNSVGAFPGELHCEEFGQSVRESLLRREYRDEGGDAGSRVIRKPRSRVVTRRNGTIADPGLWNAKDDRPLCSGMSILPRGGGVDGGQKPGRRMAQSEGPAGGALATLECVDPRVYS